MSNPNGQLPQPLLRELTMPEVGQLLAGSILTFAPLARPETILNALAGMLQQPNVGNLQNALRVQWENAKRVGAVKPLNDAIVPATALPVNFERG